MKKVVLVISLVVIVFTALIGEVYAAQAKYESTLDNGVPVGGAVYEYYYTPTPKNRLDENGLPTSRFLNDNIANYPYEIYLPNEASPVSYRIHTNYTKNTDACASCHATHTAVGESLLQWYGVIEACMACHDGTVNTTYNVVTGKSVAMSTQSSYTTFDEYMAFISDYNTDENKNFGYPVADPDSKHDQFEFYVDQLVLTNGAYFPENPSPEEEDLYWAANYWYNNVWDGSPKAPGGTQSVPLSGGAFGYGSEMSLSRHTINNAVNISTAPGGSAIAVEVETQDTDSIRWEATFTCQSCHSPHGTGGNARLLNPDPNFAASVDNKYNGVLATKLGQGLEYAVIPNSVVYAVYPGATALTQGNTTENLTNYEGIQDNTVQIPVEPFTMLYWYPYNMEISVNGALKQEGVDYELNNKPGFTYIEFYNDPGAEPVTATFTAAFKVKMEITNMLQPSETVKYKSGINKFCGSCHADYDTALPGLYQTDGKLAGQYTGSGKVLTGKYSEAHRHQVGMKSRLKQDAYLKYEGEKVVVCLTCHVAHGTSKDYWQMTIGGQSSLDTKYQLEDDALKEQTSSSALKRMPNMGVCEVCHKKGKQSAGYFLNSGQAIPVAQIGDTTDGVFTQTNATYVGKDSCTRCHKHQMNGYLTTMHSKDLVNTIPAEIAAAYSLYSGGDTANYLLANKYLLKDNGIAIVSVAMWDSISQTVIASDTNITDFEANCMRCHSSARKTQNDITQAADLGIGCEACHGPGSNHIKNPSEKNIVNPANIGSSSSSEVCGQCHTKRLLDPFGYRPGLKLSDFTSGNPTAGDVDSDGVSTIKPGEYEEFYNSKHNGGSGRLMSCATCHSSHGLNSEGKQMKGAAITTCLACHDTMMDLNQILPDGTHAFRKTYTTVPSGRTHY